MADFNPFASLVTPDVLAQQRRAAMEKEYEGADVWTKLITDAGFKMREADRARGIGLTDEDKLARQNQMVMEGTQRRYAELVESGEYTADEAQAAVLEDAIKQFSANGAWEQAISLTQPLHQLQQQKLERDKLKADITYTESRPEAKEIDQQIATMRAEQAFDAKIMQLEIAKQNAATARMALAVDLEIAAMRAERERDRDAQKEAGGGKPTVYEQRKIDEIHDKLNTATETARLMGDLRGLIRRSPGALSLAGDLSTKFQAATMAAKTALRQEGWNPEHIVDSKMTVTEWLNNHNVRQRALVTQLAYQLAKGNDPGGRLSNQDLELAHKIVAGEGTLRSRLDALDQAFGQVARRSEDVILSARDRQRPIGAHTSRRFGEAMTEYKKLLDEDLEAEERAARGAAPSAAKAPPMSFEEFKRRKAAGEL